MLHGRRQTCCGQPPHFRRGHRRLGRMRPMRGGCIPEESLPRFCAWPARREAALGDRPAAPPLPTGFHAPRTVECYGEHSRGSGSPSATARRNEFRETVLNALGIPTFNNTPTRATASPPNGRGAEAAAILHGAAGERPAAFTPQQWDVACLPASLGGLGDHAICAFAARIHDCRKQIAACPFAGGLEPLPSALSVDI